MSYLSGYENSWLAGAAKHLDGFKAYHTQAGTFDQEKFDEKSAFFLKYRDLTAPLGKLYFHQDPHNDSKWHVYQFVAIRTQESSGLEIAGEDFKSGFIYNQAICPELDDNGQPKQDTKLFYGHWAPAEQIGYKHEFHQVLSLIHQEELEIYKALQREESRQKKFELGEWSYLWRNQALREAVVIAVHGDESLFAYAMPNGAIYLNQINKFAPRHIETWWATGRKHSVYSYKTVSANNPPKKWAQAIRDAADNELHPEFWD